MNKGANKKIMKVVGDVLKMERHNMKRKISQECISQLIDISQEQYSRIENGKGRLSIIELMIICDFLGLTLTEFAFKVENLMSGASLLSPERKEKFQRWLHIYMKYYNYPPAPVKEQGDME